MVELNPTLKATTPSQWMVRLRRIDLLPWIVAIASAVILVVFLIYPIVRTMVLAFVPRDADLTWANLTFANFEQFWKSRIYRDAFWNSIFVGVATTVAATIVALPAAFIMARVRVPFRNLILSLSVVPLIAPPFIAAYSWIMLLGNRGVATYYAQEWLGIDLPRIAGPYGIVFALTLSFYPFIFLFVQAALSAADPYLEEAATVMGAKRLRILRTVTFPMVIPAIGAGAIVVFLEALGNFGVASILGGEYYVLPTLIYYQISGFFDLNAAAAIAIVNVLVTIVAIAVLVRFSNSRRFTTLTSTTRAARKSNNIALTIIGNLYIWVLLLLSLTPQIMVIYTSFATRWTSTILPVSYGFDNYFHLYDMLQKPLWNSIMLSGAATVLCVVFGTLAGYVAARKKFFGKWVLDLTIMLPFILPGSVIGVAYLGAFNTGMLVLSGTPFIIILAYFVRRLAFLYRAVVAGTSQIDVKMEEASTICGATWLYTMRRIIVPLVTPNIIAGAIIIFATLTCELTVTILLYSAGWDTVSIKIFTEINDNNLLPAATIGAVIVVATFLLIFIGSSLSGRSMAGMFK